MTDSSRCPLCGSNDASLLFTSRNRAGCREFEHCPVCDLVFVPSRYHLREEAQRSRYLEHNNDPDDADYRRFLSRLLDPLRPCLKPGSEGLGRRRLSTVPLLHRMLRPSGWLGLMTGMIDSWSGFPQWHSRLLDPLRPCLKPGSEGLDYGAGPGPALAVMMREEGFDVRLYDPFFHPDRSALDRSYDFIACTETAEHFADPARELRLLHRMLRPSGWLGLMTGMIDSWSGFPQWHYHRDPTHVCFYSKRTMEWIGEWYRWRVRFPCPNVALFQKAA